MGVEGLTQVMVDGEWDRVNETLTGEQVPRFHLVVFQFIFAGRWNACL